MTYTDDDYYTTSDGDRRLVGDGLAAVAPTWMNFGDERVVPPKPLESWYDVREHHDEPIHRHDDKCLVPIEGGPKPTPGGLELIPEPDWYQCNQDPIHPHYVHDHGGRVYFQHMARDKQACPGGAA